jgi:hypothetical protein
MGWDPAVLRKYNATGHFRLLNQVRSEIRERPLIRPGAGETVGAVNRSRSLIRAIEARAQAGMSRSRRAAQAVEVRVLEAEDLPAAPAFPAPSASPTPFMSDDLDADGRASAGFRARLNAIDLR